MPFMIVANRKKPSPSGSGVIVILAAQAKRLCYTVNKSYIQAARETCPATNQQVPKPVCLLNSF
jgi:hypothetical protein